MTGPVTSPVSSPVSSPADLAGRPVAVLVCRAGEPPLGGDEAVAEAGGLAIVAGTGAAAAAAALTTAERVWTLPTGPGLQVAALTARLAPVLAASPLVVLPASADGRDLAPRLAAALGRPLLAAATRVRLAEAPGRSGAAEVAAVLARAGERLALPVRVTGGAVATLLPGVRSVVPVAGAPAVVPLPEPPAGALATSLPGPAGGPPGGGMSAADVEVIEVLEPDAATMDLAEAPRVLAGGAGLVPAGADEATGRAVFEVLAGVAAALGASVGATRVATDAGWLGADRQIGTTGITLDPQVYVALGISGASQHTGGIGTPARIVSVNTDASCPMTAMATLGLVTDARALLAELARRLGVPVPPEAGLPDPETDVDPDPDHAAASTDAATAEEVPA